MFAHIFVNRFKCIVRDRQMLFWTFLFPILLSSLFCMGFQNINKSTAFSKIPIAVVNNAEYKKDTAFRKALDSVSEKSSGSGTRLFTVALLTQAQAEESLKDNKIKGYIVPGDGLKVVVKDSDIDQTILKEFVDDYLQTEKAFQTIAGSDPRAVQSAVSEATASKDYLKAVTTGKAKPDDILTYYYALIAMACLYGGFWGLKEVAAVQADLTAQGARVNLAPVHKLKVFGYSLCAATTVHLLSVLLLIAYMSLVLGVQFGSQLPFILLACFAGCCTGVSMGAAIGAAVKKSLILKTAVLITFSMVMSFLSGLMVAQMKYIVTNAIPAMAYLNPGNLIADCFYSLYYYSGYTRYFVNIGLLFAFSLVFYLVVYFAMRRQKYESL